MPGAFGTRRPAVFVDRDGTLHRERSEPVSGPEDLELFEGAGRAVARLNQAGYHVVVVTNQSAIARGWIDGAQLARVHAVLRERLAADGAVIDLCVWCPHHPSEGAPPYRRACTCRKPRPGLLLEAERRLAIEREGSWMIGDAARDLDAARVLGVPGILVATGKGEQQLGVLTAAGTPPAAFVPGLPEAVDAILAAR